MRTSQLWIIPLVLVAAACTSTNQSAITSGYVTAGIKIEGSCVQNNKCVVKDINALPDFGEKLLEEWFSNLLRAHTQDSAPRHFLAVGNRVYVGALTAGPMADYPNQEVWVLEEGRPNQVLGLDADPFVARIPLLRAAGEQVYAFVRNRKVEGRSIVTTTELRRVKLTEMATEYVWTDPISVGNELLVDMIQGAGDQMLVLTRSEEGVTLWSVEGDEATKENREPQSIDSPSNVRNCAYGEGGYVTVLGAGDGNVLLWQYRGDTWNRFPIGSAPANFVAIGTLLYFTANSAEGKPRLVRFDGRAVSEIQGDYSDPSFLTAADDKLMFRSGQETGSHSLWMIQRDQSTATQVAGSAPTTIRSLRMSGSDLYVAGSARAAGLWLVRENRIAPAVSTTIGDPRQLVAGTYSGRDYLSWLGTSGEGDNFLLLFDPQENSLNEYPVQRLMPGDARTTSLTALDGAVVFSGNHEQFGVEPWWMRLTIE